MPEPASESQSQPQGQSQSESQSKRTKRFRAAKACRRCNEKRVKCDAIEHGIPCTRCEQGNRNDCALIQSRRGIYQRKKNRNDSQTKTSGSEKGGGKEAAPRTASPPSQGAPASNDNNTIRVQTQEQPETTNSSRNSPNHLSEDEMQLFDAQETALPSTALTTPASHDSLASPGSGDTEMSNSSYREISWTTMFDHFLEGRKHGEAVIDKVIFSHPDLLLFSLRTQARELIRRGALLWSLAPQLVLSSL
jgi:Fungal Zn(2)-Cys(6) binuclear cluster domain